MFWKVLKLPKLQGLRKTPCYRHKISKDENLNPTPAAGEHPLAYSPPRVGGWEANGTVRAAGAVGGAGGRGEGGRVGGGGDVQERLRAARFEVEVRVRRDVPYVETCLKCSCLKWTPPLHVPLGNRGACEP